MTIEQRAKGIGVHLVLIAYSALAVGPLLLVVMNSFKARNAISARRSTCRTPPRSASSVTRKFSRVQHPDLLFEFR